MVDNNSRWMDGMPSADRLEDSMGHGQSLTIFKWSSTNTTTTTIRVLMKILKILKMTMTIQKQNQKTTMKMKMKQKPLPNFQPAINGLPQTASQSAPEISPSDAARKELQNLQRETDLKESGLISQVRPRSSQGSCQEMELEISHEASKWTKGLFKKLLENNLFD